MKITHIVNMFAFFVLLAATISVSVAIWAYNKSYLHNDRISLAHKSYERHLRLTADTYLLFKRFGDLLLGANQAQANDVGEISLRLRGHLDKIRETIEAEIRLVGDEELEELELLAEVEDVIEELQHHMQRVIAREDRGDIRSDWRQISLALNDNIKNDFRKLIAVALAEEEEEVAETEAEARAQMLLVRQISYIVAIVFLITIGLVLFLFRREFSKPLEQLLNGVRQLADGDFSKPTGLKSGSELSEISIVLDEMALVVTARTKDLTTQNEELEQAVNQRTQSLEKLLGEVRKSEANRRQLLADVSHELRTPLTIIQGESDVALRGADKTVEEYKEALNRSRIAANHTANLINDLLFIARKEAGSLHLSREQFALDDLIKNVVKLAGMGGVTTSVPENCVLFADQKRIRQAVLALLENAKRHGGDIVTIEVEAFSDALEIAVSDNGAGMSDEDKALAFERFFRGSNASEQYKEGLGLGLPIVQSIIEAHGGTARIDDNIPQGMTAILTLPINAPG